MAGRVDFGFVILDFGLVIYSTVLSEKTEWFLPLRHLHLLIVDHKNNPKSAPATLAVAWRIGAGLAAEPEAAFRVHSKHFGVGRSARRPDAVSSLICTPCHLAGTALGMAEILSGLFNPRAREARIHPWRIIPFKQRLN